MHSANPIAPASLNTSVTLTRAAANARECAAMAAALNPDHWVSPAATQFVERIRELVIAIESAVADIEGAAASARLHEAELAHVRQALLTGAQVPL